MKSVNTIKIKYVDVYSSKRPIIKLWNNIRVLIDTGADLNIWYGGSQYLEDNNLINGITSKVVEIGGISDSTIKARPYVIPFKFNVYEFDAMHILLPVNKVSRRPYDMILGMESLSNIKITVDSKERVVTACSYDLKQKDSIIESIHNGASIEEAFGCNVDSINDIDLTGNVIRDEDMIDIKKLFEDAWNL